MVQDTTIIRISNITRDKLIDLKLYPRQTYEEVLCWLLSLDFKEPEKEGEIKPEDKEDLN